MKVLMTSAINDAAERNLKNVERFVLPSAAHILKDKASSFIETTVIPGSLVTFSSKTDVKN